MVFVVPAVSLQWVAAPLIVPKAPLAFFRLTMDYRPVNAATIPTSWPMPNIDAELLDTREYTCYASLDFCSG